MFNQLKRAIANRISINNSLQVASGNDLLVVFTTIDTQRYGDLQHTFTLLGLAIHKYYGNSNVDSILTHSQRNGILRDILVAENTLHYEDNFTHTLTPLGFAIHQGRGEQINLILTKAQEGGILQDVLASENTILHPNNKEYALTPIGLAIHLRNGNFAHSILEKKLKFSLSCPSQLQHTRKPSYI